MPSFMPRCLWRLLKRSWMGWGLVVSWTDRPTDRLIDRSMYLLEFIFIYKYGNLSFISIYIYTVPFELAINLFRFLYLFTCLYIFMSVCLSIYMATSMYCYDYVSLFGREKNISTYLHLLYIYIIIYILHPNVYLHLSIYISIYPPIFLSVYSCTQKHIFIKYINT